MRNSFDIEKEVDEKMRASFQKLISYDQNEIDNPDKRHPAALQYVDKIEVVLSRIKKYFPDPHNITIGDFGCAQGNVSLLLGELGYRVLAIDINPTFLEYAKLKYERGNIEWIAENIEDVSLSPASLDVAILGECIEHCAYPEKIIEKIFTFLRPGGILIATTPNGSRIRTNLPTFKSVTNEEREILAKKQFGPDGDHHLFLFRMDEIYLIVPRNAKVRECGYLGGTILINKYSYHFLRFVPQFFVKLCIRMGAHIPFINSKTYNNIYFILTKI